MLPEIVQKLCTDLQISMQAAGINIKKNQVFAGPASKPARGARVRIEVLRFGYEPILQNFPPGEPGRKAIYSFSFVIIAEQDDYYDRLSIIEAIAQHFDKQPFVQVKINEVEYEMGLSVLETNLDFINQFWLTQQKPHQPVLLYQARISEI